MPLRRGSNYHQITGVKINILSINLIFRNHSPLNSKYTSIVSPPRVTWRAVRGVPVLAGRGNSLDLPLTPCLDGGRPCHLMHPDLYNRAAFGCNVYIFVLIFTDKRINIIPEATVYVICATWVIATLFNKYVATEKKLNTTYSLRRRVNLDFLFN